MNSQFKKGIIEMFILQIIREEYLVYGYDIMKKITRFFPEVDNSTVYSILRRLHTADLTEIELCSVSQGPQRKYYRITEKGELFLAENIAQWHNLIEIANSLGISPNN